MSEPSWSWSKETAGEYVSSDGYLAYYNDSHFSKNGWILYLNDPDRPGLRISKPFPTLRDAKAAANKHRTEAQ